MIVFIVIKNFTYSVTSHTVLFHYTLIYLANYAGVFKTLCKNAIQDVWVWYLTRNVGIKWLRWWNVGLKYCHRCFGVNYDVIKKRNLEVGGTPLEVYASQAEHVLMNALVCFCVQVYVPSWLHGAGLWKQVHPVQSLALSQWWGVPRGGCSELQVSVPHRWVCTVTSISTTTVIVYLCRSRYAVTLTCLMNGCLPFPHPFLCYIPTCLSFNFPLYKVFTWTRHVVGRTHPSLHESYLWDYWSHFDQIYQQWTLSTKSNLDSYRPGANVSLTFSKAGCTKKKVHEEICSLGCNTM